MTIQSHAENDLGSDSFYYDLNLSRARTAGYVLLTGLFLEVVASMVWFKGIESIAALIAIALVAGGVAGEIFFEHRARRSAKNIGAALPISDVPELGGDAAQQGFAPDNYKQPSQLPNRERRRLLGRCGRRVAA